MTPEEKIADLKANFDYVLEGKDLEIKTLKDRLAEEVELHLHAEEYIKELEKENEELKKINSETLTQLNLDNGELIIENEKLRKENTELKRNKKTVVHLSNCLEEKMKERIEELEQENAELKEKNRQLNNEVEDLNAYCNQIGKIKTDVLKLFEHIVAR